MQDFAFPLSPCFLCNREGHNEGCALLRDTLYRNLSTMPFHDFFADGESHAGSTVWGIPAMKPLKWLEDLVAITFIETNAVVLYEYMADRIVNASINLHDGWFRFFAVLY